MNCEHCGKPLNQSQYNATESLKSCPSCSTIDGHQHVYYEYPEQFGTTELRSTAPHPEGPQSHCNACRAQSPEAPDQIICEDRDG
jgi:phage FluMu protein Com